MDPFLSTGDKRFFLNPAAFTFPQPGQFGNLGRFALHGPGLSQFDFTLHKKFAIDEKRNFEFRAEIYNLFNRANFANPPAVLATGLGTASNQIQPGQPYTASVAGAAFGVFNSTVSKDVGLGRATADSVVAALQLLSVSWGRAVLLGRVPASPSLFVFDDQVQEQRSQAVLRRMPLMEGLPVRIHWIQGLLDRHGPVHAGSFLRERRIAFDCTRTELPRIFVHEVAHFIWLRLGNPARLRYEDVVRAEIAARAQGRTGVERGVAKGCARRARRRRADPALARILLREFLRYRGLAVLRCGTAPGVYPGRTLARSAAGLVRGVY